MLENSPNPTERALTLSEIRQKTQEMGSLMDDWITIADIKVPAIPDKDNVVAVQATHDELISQMGLLETTLLSAERRSLGPKSNTFFMEAYNAKKDEVETALNQVEGLKMTDKERTDLAVARAVAPLKEIIRQLQAELDATRVTKPIESDIAQDTTANPASGPETQAAPIIEPGPVSVSPPPQVPETPTPLPVQVETPIVKPVVKEQAPMPPRGNLYQELIFENPILKRFVFGGGKKKADMPDATSTPKEQAAKGTSRETLAQKVAAETARKAGKTGKDSAVTETIKPQETESGKTLIQAIINTYDVSKDQIKSSIKRLASPMIMQMIEDNEERLAADFSQANIAAVKNTMRNVIFAAPASDDQEMQRRVTKFLNKVLEEENK